MTKYRIDADCSWTDNFGEIMVPSEEVVELRGGQERRIQRKY